MAKPPIKNADDGHDRDAMESKDDDGREVPTANASGGTGTDVNTTTGGGGVRGVEDPDH